MDTPALFAPQVQFLGVFYTISQSFLRLVSSGGWHNNTPILDVFLSTFHFPILPAFPHLPNKLLAIKFTSSGSTYRISIIWLLLYDGNRANLLSLQKNVRTKTSFQPSKQS